MTSIHSSLDETGRYDKRPDDVITVNYCAYTGKKASGSCPVVSYYCGTENVPGYCSGKHSGLSLPTSGEEEEEEDEETEGEEGETTEGDTTGEASGQTTTTSPSSTTTSPSGTATAPNVNQAPPALAE